MEKADPVIGRFDDGSGRDIPFTLRDLFAALSLAGAISHGDTGSLESEAEEAYGYADAMLAERSK